MNDIEKLRTTVERFCAFIFGLPENALAEQPWGPREVLAHLVYWHEAYVAQLRARLQGKSFALGSGPFRVLNDQAVASCRGVPMATMVERFRTANDRLATLYASCDSMTTLIQTKQDAKPYTLNEFIPMVEAHIRNHHRKLPLAAVSHPGKRER